MKAHSFESVLFIGAITMCTHSNTKKINDVRVCLNCGLTVLPDGSVYFDKKLPNYRRKKAVKKNAKK